MVLEMSPGGRAFVCFIAGASAAAGCGGPTASLRADAQALPSDVAAVVALPLSLAYGREPERRRAERRAGDALIALTGGRAILVEELGDAVVERGALGDLDDARLAARVKALGEPPERVLTFALLASRSQRSVPNVSALAGFQLGRRIVMDYMVRLEVRQAGSADVIGTIDAVATGPLNGPEIGARGESLGVQKAIDDALAKAVRTFAPGLQARGPGAGLLVAEVPPAAADGSRARLAALQGLYPELSIDQRQALVGSRQRLLVIRPGALSAIGLAAGDLVGVPVGQTLTSRAALARELARGAAVKLVVERGGQRYVLATADASASANAGAKAKAKEELTAKR